MEWQSPEQREEVERVLADAGEKEWDAKLFAMREAMITRPGPRLTWDDLEKERAAQRRREPEAAGVASARARQERAEDHRVDKLIRAGHRSRRKQSAL